MRLPESPAGGGVECRGSAAGESTGEDDNTIGQIVAVFSGSDECKARARLLQSMLSVAIDYQEAGWTNDPLNCLLVLTSSASCDFDRQILKQPQYQTLSVPQQIAPLLAVTEGHLDQIELADMATLEAKIALEVIKRAPEVCERILDGQRLSATDKLELSNQIKHAIAHFKPV